MRIGELARRAHVRVVTVRFYEAEGLLPRAPRTANAYRDFAPDTVERVRFIRRAQELGFTLAEIRGFLAASDRRAPLDGVVRAHARAKLDELAARIADLERVRGALRGLLRRRRCAGPDEVCPIIEALAPRAARPPTSSPASPARRRGAAPARGAS
jgi:DNA-binding transcriptional MerR regulator